MSDVDTRDGKKEAVKTYIEQTKLLVILSSAFVLVPAALLVVLKDRHVAMTSWQLFWFVVAEVLFIASVLAGCMVLATIARCQAEGRFDVDHPVTKYASFSQIATYLFGLLVFNILVLSLPF